MKILVITHEFPPIGGGGATACYFLTKGFVQEGHDVTVLTASFKDLPIKEVINGVKIIRVKAQRSQKDHSSFVEMTSFLINALPKAIKLENKNRYDLCQVFFGIPSGPIAYLLKKLYKVPYVIRFGGGDIPGFQDRFKLVYKILTPFIRVLWKNSDALIANSSGLRDMAMNFYNKRNIEVVYNGIDINYFYPNYKLRESDKINILFVSRLIKRKGLQYVIPELGYLKDNVKKNIKFTVVGDGPYREYLEKQAEQYEVKEIIDFVGHKDKHEILSYYQQGDLFILPSLKEGMPNVVLEAMACGMPVIMTPCEGSKELIQENGIITPIEEFKTQIVNMCNDQENLKCCGEVSIELINKNFVWDMIVKKYIDIYTNILL